MIILGIDPGTATTGYAFIEKNKTELPSLINCGVITTSPKLSDSKRLHILIEDLTSLIKEYKPSLAGVEKLFFESNQKTVITVAQARGAILLTLEQNHVPSLEFTPLQVKNFITGFGKANKIQVQNALVKIMKLKTAPKPDDAADALAISLCTALANRHLK